MAPAIGFLGLQPDWIAAGNRALDAGNPTLAAADFARALHAAVRSGAPAGQQLHLRVTLATAWLEAGDDRQAESALHEAGPAAGLPRAEVLNAWSALHLRRGQFSAAEEELQTAARIVAQSPAAEDLRAAVSHNLAAVEMRTGRYTVALTHESEAIRVWQATLRPDHPNLIRAWASLASLQYMMGRTADARLSMRRAIAAAPSGPLLAALLESDALILDRLKMKAQAKRERAQAKAIRGAAAPPSAAPAAWNIRETSGGPVVLQSR